MDKEEPTAREREADDPAATAAGSEANASAIPPPETETQGAEETAASASARPSDPLRAETNRSANPGDPEALDVGTPAPAEGAGPLGSEVETLQAEVQRVRDHWVRTAADFDNYRKRARREQAEGEQRAREALLKDLLPVFDNLERAVKHADGASDVKTLAAGIQMVLRLFADTLARLGIERVAAEGQPFDPTLHEAVQHELTSEFPPGAVTVEVQAGYRLGTKLIRPALVVVAKAPPEA